jgi:hypothetical protein
LTIPTACEGSARLQWRWRREAGIAQAGPGAAETLTSASSPPIFWGGFGSFGKKSYIQWTKIPLAAWLETNLKKNFVVLGLSFPSIPWQPDRKAA